MTSCSGNAARQTFLWLMQTVELHVAQGIYDPYSMEGEPFAGTKDVLLPGSRHVLTSSSSH